MIRSFFFSSRGARPPGKPYFTLRLGHFLFCVSHSLFKYVRLPVDWRRGSSIPLTQGWNAWSDYSTASPSTWLTSCLPDEPAETAGHEEESVVQKGRGGGKDVAAAVTESYLLHSRSYGGKMRRPRRRRASDLSSGLLSLSRRKNVGESG